MINVVVHKTSKAIKILAPIFESELAKLGFDSKIICSDDLDEIPGSENDIFFVFTPHKFKEFKRTGLNKRANFIMYQQEQLSDVGSDGAMRINQLKPLIDKYDFVVDVWRGNEKFLEKIGSHSDMIMPTAYHEFFEFNKEDSMEAQYECLFFGRVTDKPRRSEILKNLKESFEFYPKYESLYNENLSSALLSSKIVLNIHQSSVSFPEWLRILLAISNKKLIISEPIENIYPLVENSHIIFARPEEMKEKINYFLVNKSERQKIENDAYNFVKQHYRMDSYIKNFADKFLNKNEN